MTLFLGRKRKVQLHLQRRLVVTLEGQEIHHQIVFHGEDAVGCQVGVVFGEDLGCDWDV